MRFSALPEDERDVLVPTMLDLGFVLLHNDMTRDGEPIVIEDAQGALPSELPSWRRLRDEEAVWDLLFWARDEGPVRTRGDAPPPSDDVSTVALELNRQATTEWRDLIDRERSPILKWRRSAWHQDRDCLLGAHFANTPPLTARLHHRAERRLAKSCVRVDPYSSVPIQRPDRRRPEWLWAFPAAAERIANGGEAFHLDDFCAG